MMQGQCRERGRVWRTGGGQGGDQCQIETGMGFAQVLGDVTGDRRIGRIFDQDDAASLAARDLQKRRGLLTPMLQRLLQGHSGIQLRPDHVDGGLVQHEAGRVGIGCFFAQRGKVFAHHVLPSHIRHKIDMNPIQFLARCAQAGGGVRHAAMYSCIRTSPVC